MTTSGAVAHWLVAAVLAACAALAHAGESIEANLLVQVCFVSGFANYDGKRVFSSMQVGDTLGLAREAGNLHDGNAVRVQWQGHKLGYVPSDSNEGIARQLDFGNRLRARIVRLSQHRDPDRRVEIEIYLPL